APAPPCPLPLRCRTSTNTRVPSRSRIIRSTSPPPRPGVLKLRFTRRRPCFWRCSSAVCSARSPRALVVLLAALTPVDRSASFFRAVRIVCKFSTAVARCARRRSPPALSAGRAVHGGHAHWQHGRHQPACPASACHGGHRGLRRHPPHGLPAAGLWPA